MPGQEVGRVRCEERRGIWRTLACGARRCRVRRSFWRREWCCGDGNWGSGGVDVVGEEVERSLLPRIGVLERNGKGARSDIAVL